MNIDIEIYTTIVSGEPYHGFSGEWGLGNL